MEAILGLQWPCFTLAHIAYFKSAAHSWVHHNFTRGLHFLETVDLQVVKVRCAIEVSLLVTHHLFEQIVTASFSLTLFKQQVVSRGDLIMFVVLNVGNRLVKVAVGADARSHEAVLYLWQKLFDQWHAVFADDNAFHVNCFHLGVPLVCSDIRNGDTSLGVGIQNFLDKIFRTLGNKARDQKVTVQDLFVKFACIGIFKGQVAARHCVQNNATAPNIRIKAVVTFSCNHLWCCVTGTSACFLESLIFLIDIR